MCPSAVRDQTRRVDTTTPEIDIHRARPAAEVKGGIIVIHEIWGLVDHIKEVADRFAAEGYLAYAPDILSRAGITPEAGAELMELMQHPDESVRQAAQPTFRERMAPARDPEYGRWATEALRSVLNELADELAADPGADGRLGVTGFCFGGSYAFALAAADQRIHAAVPFYGSPPDLDAAQRIGCPVLAFYGDQDERLMADLPEVTEQLTGAGVDFTAQVYPGAGHAFFNDTGARYDEQAAGDAWRRTLDFFAANL